VDKKLRVTIRKAESKEFIRFDDLPVF